jgi:tRNA(fMet)-specific endonuclease VapC
VTYVLDTNTCIGWMRQNQPQIVARIQAQTPTDIVLCSVVVAELRFGVERSIRPGSPGQDGLAC